MRTIARVLVASLTIAVTILPASVAAQNAQNAWEVQVKHLLENNHDLVAQLGGRESHEIMTGHLDRGASTWIRYQLDADVSYLFAGVCDEDCSDLDLRLYDETGTLVDADVESDDGPMVRVTPKHSATFRLRVTMARCTDSPCYFGVAVYK
jgi:hypothetical protein